MVVSGDQLDSPAKPQFLEDYLRCDPAGSAGFVDPAIKAAIEAKPGILLRELLDRAGGVPKPDEIYLLIATGDVYVDLSAAAIVEPEQVRVFANSETAGAYQRACRDVGEMRDDKRSNRCPL